MVAQHPRRRALRIGAQRAGLAAATARPQGMLKKINQLDLASVVRRQSWCTESETLLPLAFLEFFFSNATLSVQVQS
jgi:hypothetical protein